MPKRLAPIYTDEGQRQRQARRKRRRWKPRDRDDGMEYVDYVTEYQPRSNKREGNSL